MQPALNSVLSSRRSGSSPRTTLTLPRGGRRIAGAVGAAGAHAAQTLEEALPEYARACSTSSWPIWLPDSSGLDTREAHRPGHHVSDHRADRERRPGMREVALAAGLTNSCRRPIRLEGPRPVRLGAIRRAPSGRYARARRARSPTQLSSDWYQGRTANSTDLHVEPGRKAPGLAASDYLGASAGNCRRST
jgi:hypothetical protein